MANRSLFAALGSAALLVGLSTSGEARAEYLTGNALYRYCTAERSDASYYQNSAMCTGYIMGIHDGAATSGNLITYMRETGNRFRVICVPDGVEASQIRDITVAYLRDHPAERDLGAGLIVVTALLEAYPCTSADAASREDVPL